MGLSAICDILVSTHIADCGEDVPTSQIVRMLSIFRHLNKGHIVKLISTNPLPKSNPPGNLATTSRLVSAPSLLAEASNRMISPGRGAGNERIFEIWRVWDWTSLENRAQERVR